MKRLVVLSFALTMLLCSSNKPLIPRALASIPYEYDKTYYSDSTYTTAVGDASVLCDGFKTSDGTRTSYFIVTYAARCTDGAELPTPIYCPTQGACTLFYY